MESPQRHLVFISHANPEDNEFTRWLGMQLTRHGYQVWSDITKLIGGEIWWNDIEDAIRNDTAKMLFVLSRAANSKPGTRNELHLALNVERQHNLPEFVIPLCVDPDLPFSEINIQINNRNAISFTNGWADGLARVLQKLDEDNVPRDGHTFAPSTVTRWWQEHVDGTNILCRRSVPVLSNWFPITALPDAVRIIDLEERLWTDDPDGLPAHRVARHVVSFASASALDQKGLSEQTVATHAAIECSARDAPVFPSSLRYAIVRLLRMAWDHAMRDLGLPCYMMASDKPCFYFTDELLAEQKRVSFDLPGCGRGQRALTGKFKGSHWHYGLSADVFLEPVPVFVLRGHVLFSDDGKTLWDSKARLHRARRSACRDWWNDRWRDMLLASLTWISQRQGTEEQMIRVSLTGTDNVAVPVVPMLFESPVCYTDTDIVEQIAEDADWDAGDDVAATGEMGADDDGD